jgi:hypothetical protein
MMQVFETNLGANVRSAKGVNRGIARQIKLRVWRWSQLVIDLSGS